LNEGQVLAPGQDTTFFIAAGSWDLRAVPCDSSVTETTSIGADIEGDLTWTLFDE
jgi:hypothetical protein